MLFLSQFTTPLLSCRKGWELVQEDFQGQLLAGFHHRSGFSPGPEEDKVNITKLLQSVKQFFPVPKSTECTTPSFLLKKMTRYRDFQELLLDFLLGSFYVKMFQFMPVISF
jgi:hypothetical protein